MVWRPEAELLEEDAVETVIPILAGMHQDVGEAFVEARHNPRQSNDLWSGSNNGHHLHAASFASSTRSGYVSGCAGSSISSAQNKVSRSSVPVLVIEWVHMVGMSTIAGA